MITMLLERWSRESNLIIRGVKGSGKSYLAESIARQDRSIRLFDAESLLIYHQEQSSDNRSFTDIEIDHILELNQPHIIDNAEVILLLASESQLIRLFTAVSQQQFPFLWIRKRFISEDADGWYTRRERLLSRHVSKVDLKYESIDIDRVIESMITRVSSWERTWSREWLMHWSGGNLGLATKIKPHRPHMSNDLDIPPNKYEFLYEQLINDHCLGGMRTRKVFASALSNVLPHPSMIADEFIDIVGKLQAIGALHLDYYLKSPQLIGEFWRALAMSLTTPEDIHQMKHFSEDMSLKIVEGLVEIDVIDMVADSIDCSSDECEVACLLSLLFVGVQVALPPAEVLRDLLGRVTLYKLIKYFQFKINTQQSSYLLATEFLKKIEVTI